MLERVHLVFKTHLDIGFTDFAAKVAAKYFTHFIPTAVHTAKVLREREAPERFIWTTGSWLIYEYLEHASSSERTRLEQAILAGDIAWHGLSFTTHSELMDASLFEFDLHLSQELDRRFGKHTIAAKMTDVPGHTRAIVPLLAQAGIKFLHIGVNPGSTNPDVPSAFVWKDANGAEVIVMYQRGAYGGFSAVPNSPAALALAHTGDNYGPPSIEDVYDTYQRLRVQLPDATITASTLDAVAQDLLLVKESLPVVNEELGDTWIHGVGSDPLKISQFRELSRLRQQWLVERRLKEEEPRMKNFSRFLLMVPEHTWGMDVKRYLADWTHYLPAQLRSVRQQENFRQIEASWQEQRMYLHDAIAALEPSLEADEARASLKRIAPNPVSKERFQTVQDGSVTFDTPHFTLAFDTHHGALIRLSQKANGREWAAETNPLALFRYEVFSQADYDRFLEQYIINLSQNLSWASKDFGKPGIEHLVKEHRSWLPLVSAMYRRQDESGTHLLLEMTMPEESITEYGAPRHLTLEVDLPHDEALIQITLQWFEKQANRLPEAFWLSFSPLVEDAHGWRMEKLGQWISPREVVPDGNRKMHAVGTGVSYRDAQGSLLLETLDAPLVAPGKPSLLNFNNQQPDLQKGMHINLYNNVWGTNFPQWYEEDARFRFVLRPEVTA